jgi:hypothetical protein
MNRYYVETRVRVSGAFTDAAGAPADPTTVTLKITPPSEIAVVVTPTRDGVGAYHHDVTIDAPGVWLYQWQGEGALIAASPVNLIQAF